MWLYIVYVFLLKLFYYLYVHVNHILNIVHTRGQLPDIYTTYTVLKCVSLLRLMLLLYLFCYKSLMSID